VTEPVTNETDQFSPYRDHLMGVAYRMLGSRAEAEDAVQEAWLRYAGADQAGIVDLKGWLTTVVGRICLDVLRSARVRREAYVGPWLPEPYVERLPAADDPAEAVAQADRVSLALLLVLEALTPEQRVAFVLHDVFAAPFEEVADLLGTTADNARQLASRARHRVAAGERRHNADLAQQRRVQDAFMRAAAGGDIKTLLKLLAPDVEAIGDGGGVSRAARKPVAGQLRVARFVVGLFRRVGRRPGARFEPVLVNGDLGLIIESTEPSLPGRVVSTLAVGDDGLIHNVFNILNPAKLERVPRLGP
jgi:RNA polymerase sigma-70 factor, ECF subfamily